MFLASAILVSASPLFAQGPAFFPDSDPSEAFRDLTIRQLVDAADLFTRPGMSAAHAAEAAADVAFYQSDTLLFCEINTLAPGDLFCPIQHEPVISRESAAPLPADMSPSPRSEPRGPRHGFVVNCANSEPGGFVPASNPARIEVPPPAADQVPEPSAVLLLLGAAAWILLRRKL